MTDDDLPIERREFVKWGVAGAVAGAGTEAGTNGPTFLAGDPRGEDGREERVAAPELPEFLPPAAEWISVRGVAPGPDEDDEREPVWVSSTRFSVDGLANARRIQRRPVSLRELVTPQTAVVPNRPLTDWANWLGDYDREDMTEVRVEERRDLIQEVTTRTKIRGVGSGHSHSEAAVPRESFTTVKNLTGTLPRNWLKPAEADYWADAGVDRDSLIRLQAGTVLKELNREILPGEGLALPNMGSWDGQTLAGAVNTSTHGTGLGLGTFADLVRSVEIITVPESPTAPVASSEPVTRMFRIEPEDGITDPVAFARAADEHDMALVQDDDLFHSVVVGYGSVGLVYAYTLELREPYWLKEENSLERWGTFDPVAQADPDRNRHFSFLVDLTGPQLTGTSTPACFVRKRNVEEKPSGWAPTERSNTRTMLGKIVRQIPENLLPDRNGMSALEWGRRLQELEIPSDPGAIIDPEGAFRDLADVPPFEGGRNKSASYIALRRRAARRPGDPAAPPKPPVDALTTEVGVPVSRVAEAVNAVISFVQRRGRFFPAPLGVRFTGGSRHYFSPEYRRPTAMLELPVPVPERIRGWWDDIQTGVVYDPRDFEKIRRQKIKRFLTVTGMDHVGKLGAAKAELGLLQRELVRSYGGRPHMGKHNTVAADADEAALRPRDMYPEYDKWLASFGHFNSFGTFDNVFTDNKAEPVPGWRSV